jgi:peroxiredoxin family protein
MENGNGANGAKKMTIIAWSGDLDKAWPTLILATTAAASGMDVAVFFTFWGLRILQRNDKRITGRNWMQKALSLMNRGGTKHLGLSKLNFAGAGPLMMKQLAAQYKVASPTELLSLAQELGVRLWPCQMTLDLMGLRREDLIDGLGETVGAATAIERMSESDVQLFI